MGDRYLAIHGHFYQPPREDPFTGRIPREPGADPFHDFNEKINAECYRPNVRLGNFARINFDLGPTLADWLEGYDPETHAAIVAADREHYRRYGQGNAIAQAYNHTILPLATYGEKLIQIEWGLADFRLRFGRQPEGMWLAETAVDRETLALLAERGVGYTILAPWQAEAEELDVTEPYLVDLGGGRSITVFFYKTPLSGHVSYDNSFTVNAEQFTAHHLLGEYNRHKAETGEPQLLVVATDGELYGHHKPFRDLFLDRLLSVSAPEAGVRVVSLARYLRLHPPRRAVSIREDTSWSCHHGVDRWRGDCGCVPGNGTWKWQLRHAFERLAARIDAAYERETASLLADPWRCLEDYIVLRRRHLSQAEFLAKHGRRPPREGEGQRMSVLLAAQYYRHLMFTSCAFFFEDLDRIEPRNAIAYAMRAADLIAAATGADLLPALRADLATARGWRTGRRGSDIFDELNAARLAAPARRQSSRPTEGTEVAGRNAEGDLLVSAN